MHRCLDAVEVKCVRTSKLPVEASRGDKLLKGFPDLNLNTVERNLDNKQLLLPLKEML